MRAAQGPFFAFGFSGSDIFWCLKAGRAGRGSGDADVLTFHGGGGRLFISARGKATLRGTSGEGALHKISESERARGGFGILLGRCACCPATAAGNKCFFLLWGARYTCHVLFHPALRGRQERDCAANGTCRVGDKK